MKGMTIAAAVTMVLAALIGLSPFLVLLSGIGGSDFEQVGWVFMFFTVPLGLLLILVAFGLAIAVSVMGISRARNRSNPRMLIAIGALVLMVLSLGGIAVTPGAYIFDVSEESRLIVVFGVLGLAG
ncbi:MAG: hypothetical protein HQ453_08365, partial [Actinobacteria bacterium]|nr:hypothetical protein [Actinomycetota bacterium]